MKWLMSFILLVLSGAVSSAFAEEMTFDIAGKSTRFYRDPVRRFTVSKQCLKSDGSLRCQAFSSLAKATKAGLRRRKASAAHSGARICVSQVGGEIAFGKDSRGNENTFCVFPDSSMVSNGSLLRYGRQNDLKK